MAEDLLARAARDSASIHSGNLGTGSFSTQLTFTNPAGDTQTITGLYNDTSLDINFETGLPSFGRKVGISFTQAALTIWDGVSPLQGWRITYTLPGGEIVNVKIDPVMPDRSFGEIGVACHVIKD